MDVHKLLFLSFCLSLLFFPYLLYVYSANRERDYEDIVALFSGIGKLARERPKERNQFKDQMPFRVKFYGNNDTQVQYEDPCAATVSILLTFY